MTSASPVQAEGRRAAVLESALRTFARRGFRRTSVDDVARDARISRPGLYLWYPSKRELLRAAVEHALRRDVTAAEVVLGAEAPLRTRLADALDLWTGQYVGPLAADLDALLELDQELLGDLATRYRDRFRAALTAAVAADRAALRAAPPPEDAEAVADVLLALVAGTKRQAADRHDLRRRLDRGLDLVVVPSAS